MASRKRKATTDPQVKNSWPADKVERRSVKSLLAYPRNAREHSPQQVDQIVASMKEYGWTVPILVDEQGVIIAGHGRLMAANKIGVTEVPVMTAAGWTDEQKRAYRLADNQIPMNASWNENLRIELTELKIANYPLEIIGFDDIQLVQFMSGLAPSSGQSGAGSLAAQFGVVPFSVLNAREGWWQDRKRAWLSLGIQSELGRGDTPSTSARVGPDEPTTYRPIGGRKANATPAGSLMPAADYAKGERGDGRGRSIRRKPNAIPGGAMLPLDRAKA